MIADDERDLIEDNRFEAESLGFKFIELKLNPKHVRGMQEVIQFQGALSATVYPDGYDNQTGMNKSMVKIKSDPLIFKFIKQRRAWIGYLLDDDQPGELERKRTPEQIEKNIIAKKMENVSHNRNFLATHEDYFEIINNLEVQNDVMRRIAWVNGAEMPEPEATAEERQSQEIAELKAKLAKTEEERSAALELKSKQTTFKKEAPKGTQAERFRQMAEAGKSLDDFKKSKTDDMPEMTVEEDISA